MAFEKINHIAALVVWYHPSDREVETARLYAGEVEHLIIVDNSDTDNVALTTTLPNVTYLPCMENLGIASALNRGCEKAIQLGAEWVLTMDQDSLWNQQTVSQYVSEAEAYPEGDQVGIFSPYHDCDGTPDKHRRDGRFEKRMVQMCSGNLLRLSAWQQAGGFRDDFFIDLVDDEICCHLWQLGFQVVRLNHICLTHHLGEGVHLLPITKHPYTPHPTWRYYYIGRNLQRMIQLYPEHRAYYRKHAYKELKRLCLYDWSDKCHKLGRYLRGWRDGLQPYPNSVCK